MHDSPTRIQLETLKRINDYINIHGFPPSLWELVAFGGYKSTQTIRNHMKALERYGCLEKRPHTARSVKITSFGLEKIADMQTTVHSAQVSTSIDDMQF